MFMLYNISLARYVFPEESNKNKGALFQLRPFVL